MEWVGDGDKGGSLPDEGGRAAATAASRASSSSPCKFRTRSISASSSAPISSATLRCVASCVSAAAFSPASTDTEASSVAAWCFASFSSSCKPRHSRRSRSSWSATAAACFRAASRCLRAAASSVLSASLPCWTGFSAGPQAGTGAGVGGGLGLLSAESRSFCTKSTASQSCCRTPANSRSSSRRPSSRLPVASASAEESFPLRVDISRSFSAMTFLRCATSSCSAWSSCWVSIRAFSHRSMSASLLVPSSSWDCRADLVSSKLAVNLSICNLFRWSSSAASCSCSDLAASCAVKLVTASTSSPVWRSRRSSSSSSWTTTLDRRSAAADSRASADRAVAAATTDSRLSRTRSMYAARPVRSSSRASKRSSLASSLCSAKLQRIRSASHCTCSDSAASVLARASRPSSSAQAKVSEHRRCALSSRLSNSRHLSATPAASCSTPARAARRPASASRLCSSADSTSDRNTEACSPAAASATTNSAVRAACSDPASSATTSSARRSLSLTAKTPRNRPAMRTETHWLSRSLSWRMWPSDPRLLLLRVRRRRGLPWLTAWGWGSSESDCEGEAPLHADPWPTGETPGGWWLACRGESTCGLRLAGPRDSPSWMAGESICRSWGTGDPHAAPRG
mmetsp:Transcript_27270/g.70707  ORF Transcript_27270/g.70707 Transcript_27270/m.70707 type:complete len:628 (-) Transcript_27270:1529-3412(-)